MTGARPLIPSSPLVAVGWPAPPAGLPNLGVGIAATPNGRGYILVARDGGVFPFGPQGSTPFHGSIPGIGIHCWNSPTETCLPPARHDKGCETSTKLLAMPHLPGSLASEDAPGRCRCHTPQLPATRASPRGERASRGEAAYALTHAPWRHSHGAVHGPGRFNLPPHRVGRRTIRSRSQRTRRFGCRSHLKSPGRACQAYGRRRDGGVQRSG